MKNLKKIIALMLAMVMVLSMAIPAMAHTTGSTVKGDTFTYEGEGATSNGEIKMSNATEDVTYTLYKVFDATYDAQDSTKVSYTVKAGALKDALDSDYFTVGATPDADGNYSVTRTGTTDTSGTFTPNKTDAEVIAYIKTLTAYFTNIGAIKSTENGEIKWEKIPYGYYYISPDQPVSDAAVTIDTVNPTVTVIDKNQVISDEKDIIETDDEGEEIKKKVNEAGLNEDIDFRITVNATNYDGDKKVYKYVICDNIEAGMTFKADSAPVIKVDDTVVPAENYTIKYYTDNTKATEVTGDDLSTAQYFEIVIKWTDTGKWSGTHLYSSNAVLTVEYTAFLDPNKRDQLVIGGTNDGNTNEAQVKWYSDIEDQEEEPEEPNGKNPKKYTDTFTTELTILKKDQDGNALQGAEFTLTGPEGAVVITKTEEFVKDASGTYWKLKDGTYTTQDPDGTIDGKPVDKTKYDSLTDKYKVTTSYKVVGAGQPSTDIKVEVGTDGKATFTGLGAGDYKLVETKVPAGYNKVDDIEFTITMTEADDSTSQTGKTVTFATDNENITVEADNTLSMDVINKKGTELPSTGGIGTTMFYVVGSILVIGAAVLLISKKRMSTR